MPSEKMSDRRSRGTAVALLRRHVPELALELAGLGVRLPARRLGDAEIEELHRAGVGDHQVLRRHVAMHQVALLARRVAELVRRMQPGASLGHDVRGQAPVELHPPGPEAPQQPADALPLQVLEHQEELALALGQLVHRHHVGVLDRGGDVGLVDEHVDEASLAGQLGEHALDDHGVLEPARADEPPEEHLGHAPIGELAEDLEAADSRPVGRAHLLLARPRIIWK